MKSPRAKGARPMGARVRGVIALAIALAAEASARDARPALTSSESAQIASYVAEAHVATAGRVRALVARPDLTADESSSAMSTALAPVAFTEARAAYLHEMIYGPASIPSRGVLAVAIVRALASRADAVFGRHDADLDQDPASIAELVRLYAFVDNDIANAGAPHGASHDPSAGIADSAYDDAMHALADHVARHPRWLGGDAKIPALAEPVRAELQLAIVDMTNDTPSRKIDAANALVLGGPRRAAFLESGVLTLDDGHASDARLEGVRALIASCPGARADVAGVALTELRPVVTARGAVLSPPASGASLAPFGEDVVAPPIDAALVGIARELTRVEVKRALEMRADLRAQAAGDVGGDPTSAITEEATRLTLDAPTAVDRAMERAISIHDKSALLLSDALGTLATFGAPGRGGLTVAAGAARSDGTVTTSSATSVRLAATGAVTSFAMSGHAWAIPRDGAPPTRDGAPITSAMLERARAPLSTGSTWSGEGLVFARLSGAPRASVTAAHVRVVGVKGGYDAIATPAPGDEVSVDAQLDVHGAAALVLRAASSPTGFTGIGLTIDTTVAPPRASLRVWSGGKSTAVGDAIALAPAARYDVRVGAKGATFEARVGTQTLQAPIPAALAHGDVALVAIDGGAVDASGWSVKKP